MSKKNPVTIYHNPRCSKSRATLGILEENQIDAAVVKYLDTPPTTDELTAILDMLGLEPRQLMRKHESEYKAAGLDDESLSREALIQGMVDNPKLIERPIVIANGQARIGRPPELVLELF